MSTLKTVGNKLFKTELANHKVELALLDNLKSYTSALKQYSNDGSKLKELATKLKTDLFDAISNIQDHANLGDSVANDMAKDLVAFEKQAKELGIDPKTSKDFIAAEDAFKFYSTLAKDYQNLAKSLK
jgi:hypothetical protein